MIATPTPQELLAVLRATIRNTTADLRAVEDSANGIALDAAGHIAKGLRIADGDGTHDEPVTRHLTAEWLWHAAPARRAERAAMLRALADLLEADSPAANADLVASVPDEWMERLTVRAMEDVLRRRADAAEAESGLSRRDFERQSRAMLRGANPRTFDRLIKRLWSVAYTLFKN